MAASEMKFAFGATVDEAARRAVVWSSDHRTATGDERGIRRRAARIAAAKWDGRDLRGSGGIHGAASALARGRRLRRARRALQLAPRPAPSQLRRRLGASPRERRINQEANQN